MIRRGMPWWAVLALGAACGVVGIWLLAEPFRSLSVLVWLVAAALVLSGSPSWRRLPSSPLLGLTFLTTPPWEIDRGSRSSPRTPPAKHRPVAPILITPGDADPIITPDVRHSS